MKSQRVRELQQQHLDLSKLDEKQINREELERLGVPYKIVRQEEEEATTTDPELDKEDNDDDG